MDVNAGERAFSHDDGVSAYISLMIKSLRPEQYYKNLLVFAGLIFSLRALEFHLWGNAFATFVIFCMLSGSLYAINDVLDIGKDKNHPAKRLKPIASGRLGILTVAAMTTALIAFALMLSYVISEGLLIVSALFIALNLLYDLLTRDIPVLDALSIAVIFIVRVIAGCVAVGVATPLWFTLCIFLLALLLVFGKRRSQLTLLGDKARDFKRSFKVYDFPFLDGMINVLSVSLFIAYLLYVYYSGSIYVILTIPFIIYGLLRYLYLVRSRHICELSDMLLTDGRFVACIVIWVCINTVALYG